MGRSEKPLSWERNPGLGLKEIMQNEELLLIPNLTENQTRNKHFSLFSYFFFIWSLSFNGRTDACGASYESSILSKLPFSVCGGIGRHTSLRS